MREKSRMIESDRLIQAYRGESPQRRSAADS